MGLFESIRIALGSLLSHKLRSALTLLSMAIGVFAIVGVATAVGSLEGTISEQLISLGRNDFLIMGLRDIEMHGAGDPAPQRSITMREAERFAERMGDDVTVGLSTTMPATSLTFEELTYERTPIVIASNEEYFTFMGASLDFGRFITQEEEEHGEQSIVVGADIVSELELDESDLGKILRLDGRRYRLIGALAAKGAIMGQSQDNFVVIPIRAAAKGMFSAAETSIDIVVRSTDERLDDDIDEAIGVLRGLHKLGINQENDFEIVSQREITDQVGGFLQYITFFGLFCGIIALLAAGIGVMNIMLVTVKERTREIGIRKAIGARRTDILRQFMIEAITISQLGALIGIIAGIVVGLLLGVLLGAPITIPWTSVGVSSGICLGIGIVFGSFPAWIASGLDPVEALRYE